MRPSRACDFSYLALSTDGRAVRGLLDATSSEEARGTLLLRGLLPIEIAPSAVRRWRRTSLPVADLAVGLRMLADLLAAGLPMGRALDVFREIAPDSWQRALGPIRAAVREGKSLASALAESPVEVPALVVGMARTGESGDGIADAIRRAASHSESVAATRAAIHAALAYPIIVAGTGVLCIAIMIGVVLPRFALILADLGQALPATTQFVLRAAEVARLALIPSALLAVAAVVVVRTRMRTPDGSRMMHRALLAVPLVGGVRWSSSTSRVTAALSAVIDSGVTIPAGLELAARAAADAEIEARLAASLVRIKAGESLASALNAERAVTPLAVRLIHAGEESGRLADMLSHAASMEQARVSRALQIGVRALEPMMIVSFAALVGLVAVALLQAVYAVRPL